MPGDVYACYSRDDSLRRKCTSGGIYAVIAKKILQSGGVVYAARYTEAFEVEHCRIKDVGELEASFGSKYMQSRLGSTFREVKEDLEAGRTVLFAGTPCQCAGLLSFAGNSERLFCTDLICHGVPSRLAWKRYLEDFEKKRFPVRQVNMRDKTHGWNHYSLRLDGTDRFYSVEMEKSAYIRGFTANFFLRPSCYECRFRGLQRNTDLTLGDFWNIESLFPELNDDLGVSAVLVHSEKGRRLFEAIENEIIYREAPADFLEKYNENVITSPRMPESRAWFFDRLQAGMPFERAVRRIFARRKLEGMIRKGKRGLKHCLGKK